MPAYVQSNAVTGFGTTSCPYTGIQTAGNTNVVSVLCTATGVTINDTSNTYVKAVTDLHGSGPFYYLTVFYCLSITGAAAGRTVSVVGGGTTLNIDVAEYSGIGSTLDGAPVTATGQAATGSLSITTANASDCLVGCMATEATATSITTAAPFTQRKTTTGGYNGAVSDDIVSSIGTYTATWNWTGADNFYLAIIPFKSATGAAPPVGDTRFGFSTHFGQPTGNSKLMMPQLATTGVAWIRDNVSWPNFNPSNGVFTPYPQDNGWLIAAGQEGIRVVAVIGGNTLVGTNPPYDQTQMGAFCAWLSGQYAGIIGAVEIINEPDTNIPAFAGAAGETKYEQLITAVTAAVNAGPAPSCQVVGCCYKGSVLIGMLPSCTMDGVSYHPYDPGSSPNVIPELVYEPPYNTFANAYPQWISALSTATALPKWETEWGCATVAGLTQDMQSNYLTRRILLASAFAVDHTFIYEYIDFGTDGYGVAIAGGVAGTITPKLSFAVLHNLISSLQGVTGAKAQATTSQVSLTVNGALAGNTKGLSYRYTGANKTVVSYWLGYNAPQSPPAATTCSISFPITHTYQAAQIYDPVANASVPFSNFTSSLSGGVLSVSGLPISDQPQLIILQVLNQVSVTFSGVATTVDIHALEFTNANLPPLEVDVTKTGTGTSTTPNTAAFSTNQTSDLLIGAASSAGGPLSVGTGFTRRALTSRLITEEKLATNPGSYTGQANLTSSSAWVMQVAALEAFVQGTSAAVVNLTGIPTAQAFGVITANAPAVAALTGIPTAQAFGVITANAPAVVPLTGIPSGQAFGILGNTQGNVNVPLTGIGSAQAFGVITANAPAVVALTGIGSLVALGVIAVDAPAQLFPSGIPSAEAFGTLVAFNPADQFINLTGIISAEAFGTLTEVPGNVNIPLTGIVSATAFGLMVVIPASSATLRGITSAEAFGIVRATFVGQPVRMGRIL